MTPKEQYAYAEGCGMQIGETLASIELAIPDSVIALKVLYSLARQGLFGSAKRVESSELT